MAVKIYQEKPNNEDVFVKLIYDNGIPVLAMVNEGGNIMPQGFIADITPDGLKLRGAFNADGKLGIVTDRGYIQVTK